MKSITTIDRDENRLCASITPSKRARILAAQRRALTIASALIYSASLLFAYKTYLYPVWGYYGFSFSEPSAHTIAYSCLGILITSSVLPTSLNRPSSVTLLFLYAIVYVPSLVVTACLSGDSISRHSGILTSLTVAIAFSGLVSRLRTIPRRSSNGQPSRKLLLALVIAWVFMVLLNVATYYSIMSFATIETMYEQREAGTSKNYLIAYVQSLFSSVFSPALFSIGLIYRNWIFIFMGVVGSLVIYSITAQKTILLLPIVIYLFYRLQSSRIRLINNISTPLLILSLITFASSLFHENSVFAALLAAMLVFRTIAIPGLTFSQYHDFFSQHGFTWWSHVKGFSLLIPPPNSLALNHLWPALGYLIGEHVYGREDLNANANLFSGDGVAAAGGLGVLLIGLVFALWLRLLDKISEKWDTRYASLAILPFAISLTNGHFFTSLLSFGGIAWLVLFFCFRPRETSTK